MALSNPQRADLLRHAFREMPEVPNGAFHFRLFIFDVLEDSSIDADDFANRFVPPGKPIDKERWAMLPLVCDYIHSSQDLQFKTIDMLKLLHAI
ncbi:hypothetical protein N5C62_22380 [Pseudomonas atacamensis]|uniref:hypothetical protein n=1 Tax=Pseudomonas atacamensis TaxID=2565368 RepID=UPI00244CF5E5|nr:hypothetical protein [Pseudomonas atacamensis]MDH1260420.1 hypothetical protein [Pseudomonas atacamensis]